MKTATFVYIFKIIGFNYNIQWQQRNIASNLTSHRNVNPKQIMGNLLNFNKQVLG